MSSTNALGTGAIAPGARSEAQAGPRPLLVYAALALVILIACARVVATWSEFNHTHDAAAHLATGLQWLQDGEFTLETLHPPLARVSMAVGPYLRGARLPAEGNLWPRGLSALHDGGDYWGMLAAARAGMLPYLALALVATFLWGRAVGGPLLGLTAAAIASLLPPVLGNAGFAATDMAVGATLPLALLAFWRWLDAPTRPPAILFLGLWAALAVLSKFTALIYLAAGGLAVFVWHWVSGDGPRLRFRPAAVGLLLAATVAAGVVWAGYRFSVGTVMATDPERVERGIDRVFGARGVRHDVAGRLAELTLPAPELPAGLLMSAEKGAHGHTSYFRGENAKGGWPSFFPVTLAVKTPVPALLLFLFGCLAIVLRRADRGAALPLAVGAAMLLAVIPSPVALGVRHVLPLYPFIAVVAALGVFALLRLGRITQGLVAALALWLVVETAAVHPNYLPYMNVFARDAEPPLLINADLDWGQDLARLARRLDELEVEEINLCWPWTARLDDMGLPPVRELAPYEVPEGWTALSVTCIYRGNRQKPFDQYAWARGLEDYETVGQTIRLYELPAATPTEEPQESIR